MEALSSSADDAASEHGPGFCHKFHLIGTTLCGNNSEITAVFIITVFILIVTELLLKGVETFVRDTQYESVKNKVFQEMTGIGLMSFLTILVNAPTEGTIPGLHYLHHADLVMFIMSSLYLLQISTHMYLSSFQYKQWKIAGGTQVCDVIDQLKSRSYSFKYWWWLGDSTARFQMEYKVLFSIFCRKFNIRRTDFNFAAYLNESFRGYILTLIEESFFVRLVFAFLVGLNAVRVKVISFPEHEWGHCDEHCKATRLLAFYAICGWVLLLSSAVLLYVSRLYEFRLICRAGVSKVSDYRDFLLREEEREIGRHKKDSSLLGPRQDSLSLNKEDLKTTLQAIKEAKEDEADNDYDSTIHVQVRRFFAYMYVSCMHRLGLKVNRSRLKSIDMSAMGLDDEQSESDDEGSSSDSDDDVESQSRSGPDDVENFKEDDPDHIVEVNAESRKHSESRKKRAKKILKATVADAAAGPQNTHNKFMKQMSFATLLTLKGAIKHTVGHDDAAGQTPTPARRSHDARRQSVAGSRRPSHMDHHHHPPHHPGHHAPQNGPSNSGPNRRKNTLAGGEHVSGLFTFLLYLKISYGALACRSYKICKTCQLFSCSILRVSTSLRFRL
jgi:hypothetical protein